jgi:hypothetical protein
MRLASGLRFGLAFTAIFGLAAAVRAADAPAEAEVIHTQAQACADAMLKENYEKFADLTYPKVIELMGGRAKLIELVRQGQADMRARNTALTEFTCRPPAEAVAGGPERFAVVPFTMRMTVGKSKIRRDGYLLAISGDGGKNWTFLSGTPELKAQLKELTPNAPAALKLPPPSPIMDEK